MVVGATFQQLAKAQEKSWTITTGTAIRTQDALDA